MTNVRLLKLPKIHRRIFCLLHIYILFDLIDLSETELAGRRYNGGIIIISLKLFLITKSCYKMIKSFLPLPSPLTLNKNIGSLNNIVSEAEAEEVCKNVFASKRCEIVIHEVRV